MVYVIAEAGVNHNGDISLAHKLVDVAADAGADAVKFQVFQSDKLVAADAEKAAYQQRTTGAGVRQIDMLRELELPFEAFEELKTHSGERGMDFLATPFDFDSIDFLTGPMALQCVKLPSGEITNAPFLLRAARAAHRCILSTGASTLDEVRQALEVIAFGLTDHNGEPSRTAFREAFSSAAGQAALKERVTVLHCTTDYPAPAAQANLRAMDDIRSAFGVPVGLSDHSDGTVVAVAAAARGATVIEKHFTLDRGMPGPDHAASLEPSDLIRLVGELRIVEQALGDGTKRPQPCELDNQPVIRRSLVAACPIATGDLFTEENIAIKRPARGASPMAYWELLGTRARRAYSPDEALEL